MKRRKNALIGGSKISLHIPQDVNLNVLQFLENCNNVNKTIFEILTIYVNGKYNENFDVDKLKMLEQKHKNNIAMKKNEIEIKQRNIETDKKEKYRNDDSFDTPDWM